VFGIIYGIVIVIIIMGNIGIAELVHRSVVKEYYRTNSPSKANLKLKRLQYVHVGITPFAMLALVVAMAFLAKEIMPNNLHAREAGRFFISNIFPFLYPLIIWTASSMIYYNTYKVVRSVDETKADWVWKKFIEFVLFIFPIFFMSTRHHIIEKIETYIWIWNIGFALLGVIAIRVLQFYFIQLILHTEPIKDNIVKQMITDILKNHNIKNCVIYQFSSIKSKYVNAYVMGVLSKKILISDYLIKQFTNNEFEAIITHEIAHLKKYHLSIQLFIILFGWLFFREITYTLGIILESIFGFYIPYALGVIIPLTVVFSYILLGFPLLSRFHERQADAYAIRTGILPEVLISALTKGAQLNESPETLGKFEEKFESHPSLSNRIKYIKKFAESMNTSRKQSSKRA